MPDHSGESLQAAADEMRSLLLVAICPACAGRGWYVEPGHACRNEQECMERCPEPMQVECEWCARRKAATDGSGVEAPMPSDKTLVQVAVSALRPYDILTGRSWSDDERREPAERVLRALWDEFGIDMGHHLADLFGRSEQP